MAETKVCTGCGRELPVSDFDKRRISPDGLGYRCSECRTAYRLKSREKRKVYARKYDAEHRTENTNRHLKRTFGITLADYDEMLEAQGGCCAICGTTPWENKQRLGVDHDHETGRIRGLLCKSCNRAIGFLQDSPELCRLAMLYLRGFEDDDGGF